MSDPAYDGLCGIPALYPTSEGRYVRCRYDFGHHGDHSWKGKRGTGVHFFGGITADEVEGRARQGSPAAQAILAASSGVGVGMKSTNDPILDAQAACRSQSLSEDDLRAVLLGLGWPENVATSAIQAATGNYLLLGDDGLYTAGEASTADIVKKILSGG